jgi:hypothetical protein
MPDTQVKTATVTTTVEIQVDLAMVAQVFASLDDEDQTQFFVLVAKEAEAWDAETQWHYIGRHLNDCDCSSEGARRMIESIAYAMGMRWPGQTD